MADKREQCKKCKRNCPTYIVQVKLEKGRIPFEECMDFMPIQTNADRIRSMTDKEMSTDLIPLIMEVCEDGVPCNELFLDWLQSLWVRGQDADFGII